MEVKKTETVTGDALCDTCRSALLADRYLSVERPGIMRQPKATPEDPCSWPSHDYEMRRAQQRVLKAEKQDKEAPADESPRKDSFFKFLADKISV